MSDSLQSAGAVAAEKRISSTQIALRFFIAFPLLALVLFGTAGTVQWIEAWIFLIAQLCYSVLLVVWLAKHDPALLQERMTFLRKSGKTWDKFFVLGFSVLSIPCYLLPGLDAVRYHWSHVPVAVQGIALLVSIAGASIVAMAMRTNTFLTPVIEIQHRRGHHVVSTGPYAYVRHPMYVGIILHVLGLPVFLGSYWTLAVGIVLCAALLTRTYFEDRMLHRELQGYAEYAQHVRYRIFPGLW